MAREPSMRWQPAPGWPTPPKNWSPPPGWQPDPSWPSAPAEHRFWQRTRSGRGRRRTRQALVGLLVLIVGGCSALAIFGPACSVDLPPGDVATFTVTNDAPRDVTLLYCDDDRCRRGVVSDDLKPGQHAELNDEQCSGGTIGVLDAKTRVLRGCIAMPVGEPSLPYDSSAVSAVLPCRDMGPAPVRPRIQDSG